MFPGELFASPFKKSSQTRWLVRGIVMERIRHNWDALFKYFDALCKDKTTDQKVRAMCVIIRDMLNEPANRLYFEFLCLIVAEYERVNAMFQCNEPNVVKMHREFSMQVKSMKDRIYYPDGKTLKEMRHVTFGARFLDLCSKQTNPTMVAAVQKRCHEFLVNANDETRDRVSGHMETMAKMAKITPEVVLHRLKEGKVQDLPFQEFIEDLDVLESQLQRINYVDWLVELNIEEIPDNAAKFWGLLSEYSDEEGERPFKDVAGFFLISLSLPLRSAYVERVFSIVTYIKEKYANRMLTSTLDAVLSIKSNFNAQGKCCKDMCVSPAMLARFTMYPNHPAPGQKG